MPDLTQVLEALKNTNQALALAIPVANGVSVIARVAVRTVKEIKANDGEVEYILIVSAGEKELAEAMSSHVEGLTLINSELRRLGLSELTIPKENSDG